MSLSFDIAFITSIGLPPSIAATIVSPKGILFFYNTSPEVTKKCTLATILS